MSALEDIGAIAQTLGDLYNVSGEVRGLADDLDPETKRPFVVTGRLCYGRGVPLALVLDPGSPWLMESHVQQAFPWLKVRHFDTRRRVLLVSVHNPGDIPY